MCYLYNKEIRPADRRESESEREGRERRRRDAPTMASRHAHAPSNNGRARRICQTGVNCQPVVPRGDRPREPRNVGQTGRDFAVARRAIGSGAWARNHSTIMNDGCSRSEWRWYRDERYLEPQHWFLFRRTLGVTAMSQLCEIRMQNAIRLQKYISNKYGFVWKIFSDVTN